jgi:hypothetical protein
MTDSRLPLSSRSYAWVVAALVVAGGGCTDDAPPTGAGDQPLRERTSGACGSTQEFPP